MTCRKRAEKTNKALGAGGLESSGEADSGEVSGVARGGLTEAVTLTLIVEWQEGASPTQVQGRELQAMGRVRDRGPEWERTGSVGWRPVWPCVEDNMESRTERGPQGCRATCHLPETHFPSYLLPGCHEPRPGSTLQCQRAV